MKVLRIASTVGALACLAGTANAEVSANGTVTNNYLWRGLTQTTNQAAVQGGIDYAADNGFYVGTWVSNVDYAPGDLFSYEHDIYFGFAGGDAISWDVGWLYYNYDDEANFDFHELYGSIGYGGFSATLFLLTGTEADEAPGQDFGFGETYYASLDYAFELQNGFGIGVHVGRHAGDFNEGFNAVPGDYTDYNVNFTVSDFTFMISDTDLEDPGPDGLDNDSTKFVIAYSKAFGL